MVIFLQRRYREDRGVQELLSPVVTESSVLHPAVKSCRTTVSSQPPESCTQREKGSDLTLLPVCALSAKHLQGVCWDSGCTEQFICIEDLTVRSALFMQKRGKMFMQNCFSKTVSFLKISSKISNYFY